MRAFLYSVLVTMVSMTALAEPDGTTTVLSYRYHWRGLPAWFVDATSADGACNVTVISSTGNGAAKYTLPLDPATFDKLMAGAKAILAARGNELAAADVRDEPRHVIATRVQNKDGSKSEKYVVLAENAPEVVRAWVKLLRESLPKPKLPQDKR